MPGKTLFNWTRYPKVDAEFFDATAPAELPELLHRVPELIARGNGRSYGDASLGTHVFSTLGMNTILSLDETQLLLHCESGVLLETILAQLIPKGLFLPVVPGTALITVGGAIAADVHGKNHCSAGSFTQHVESFELLISDGTVQHCSRSSNSELFRSTCGGLGLTGIILSATLRLRTIENAFLQQENSIAHSPAELFSLFEQAHTFSYSVAWMDCSSGKAATFRSVLSRGEHAPLGSLTKEQQQNPFPAAGPSRLSIPFTIPSFVLNALSIRIGNALRFRREEKRAAQTVTYSNFFFPLDAIRNWNRLYGRKGFLQYQFVVPGKTAQDTIHELLDRVAHFRERPLLTVLKKLGDANPDAVMSFPMRGYTLALDYRFSPALFPFFDELDLLVHQAGGRLYLVKDARQRAAMFARMYPAHVKSTYFKSALSKRLGI